MLCALFRRIPEQQSLRHIHQAGLALPVRDDPDAVERGLRPWGRFRVNPQGCGQPAYVNDLFFAIEHPGAEVTIVEMLPRIIPLQLDDEIAPLIEEALRAKEEGKEKVILFNLSGHGYLDLQAYADYHDGKLVDYEYPEVKIKEALARLPKI